MNRKNVRDMLLVFAFVVILILIWLFVAAYSSQLIQYNTYPARSDSFTIISVEKISTYCAVPFFSVSLLCVIIALLIPINRSGEKHE